MQGYLMFLHGSYVGWAGVAKSWAPFVVVAALGSYFGRATFWYSSLGALPVALLIFWLGQQCRPRPATAHGAGAMPSSV